MVISSSPFPVHTPQSLLGSLPGKGSWSDVTGPDETNGCGETLLVIAQQGKRYSR